MCHINVEPTLKAASQGASITRRVSVTTHDVPRPVRNDSQCRHSYFKIRRNAMQMDQELSESTAHPAILETSDERLAARIRSSSVGAVVRHQPLCHTAESDSATSRHTRSPGEISDETCPTSKPRPIRTNPTMRTGPPNPQQ